MLHVVLLFFGLMKRVLIPGHMPCVIRRATPQGPAVEMTFPWSVHRKCCVNWCGKEEWGNLFSPKLRLPFDNFVSVHIVLWNIVDP